MIFVSPSQQQGARCIICPAVVLPLPAGRGPGTALQEDTLGAGSDSAKHPQTPQAHGSSSCGTREGEMMHSLGLGSVRAAGADVRMREVCAEDKAEHENLPPLH